MTSLPQPTEVLTGLAAIAGHLTARVGIVITPDRVIRWSKHPADPLPIRRLGPGLRPRLLARVEDLNRWLAANLRGPGGDDNAPPERQDG